MFYPLQYNVHIGENSQSTEKKISDEFNLYIYWGHSVGHKSVHPASVIHVSGELSK